jgi:hypothetical protein
VTDVPLPDSIYYSANEAGLGLRPEPNGVKVYVLGTVSQNNSFILFAAPFGPGCRAQGSLNMVAKPPVMLTVSGDTIKSKSQEITLGLSGAAGPYTVSPKGLLLLDSVTYISRDTVSRTYTFRSAPSTDPASTPCVATASHSIRILPPTPVKPLFIPNLVLKSGAAANQVFAIEGATVQRLQIFGQWGQRILDTSQYANNWAGNAGVYFYSADISLPSGEKRTAKGWVEVME